MKNFNQKKQIGTKKKWDSIKMNYMPLEKKPLKHKLRSKRKFSHMITEKSRLVRKRRDKRHFIMIKGPFH